MNPSDIMRKIGADLEDYCMELQQIYPEYTRSLIKEEDLKDKSPEEIDEMIMTKPILAASMPYILESSWWSPSLNLRTRKETPDFIVRDLTIRFQSHIKVKK